MDSSRNAALAAELERSLRDVQGVVAIYLFGSALRTLEPNDVDLVVVYGHPLTPLTAPTTRAAVEEAVRAVMHLPAHLIFFSEQEAREPGLMSEVNPLLLYDRSVS